MGSQSSGRLFNLWKSEKVAANVEETPPRALIAWQEVAEMGPTIPQSRFVIHLADLCPKGGDTASEPGWPQRQQGKENGVDVGIPYVFSQGKAVSTRRG